jgi:hypothetical protein
LAYKDCKNLPYAYSHGGGGGWRDLYVVPTFQVNKLGVKETVLVNDKIGIPMRRNAGHDIALAVQPGWTAHVQCSFKDGDEQFVEGPLVLSSQDVEEATTRLIARYADGTFYLSTPY